MGYEEVTIQRDVELVQIPQGISVTIPADTPAVITQALGDSYTLQLPTYGGLYRLDGKDADAIGKARAVEKGEDAGAERPVTEELIYDQLRNVYDPEIPVNIVELGLVYNLEITPLDENGVRVDVKMTLTAPGCGMGDFIAQDARQRILSVPGVAEANVEVVFEPPWNQQMMSEAARLELGLM